jgi:YfiH family protein
LAVSFRPRLDVRWARGLQIKTDDGARSAGVLVAFTDRRGGESRPPYDELNLGMRVGDDPRAAENNRRRAARAIGFDSRRLVLARGVHGADIIEAGLHHRGVIGEADGLVARAPGPVLGVLSADCAAVVLAGRGGLAVIHAGWRGLVAGVVERGLAAVGPVWGAWIGPSIHACCYEVGPDVIAAFSRRELPIDGPERVDPGRAAEEVLAREGVEQIAVDDECTYCSGNLYSYRRDGVTGRHGAFATLLETR